MRVTLDTNVIDRVVRPENFKKDASLPASKKINSSLKNGTIEGFLSETIITIEGVQKADRATVFGNTILKSNHKPTYVNDGGITVIPLELQVIQSDRKPLDQQFSARIQSALSIGLRLLRAPRIGGVRIEDPESKLYLEDTDLDLRLNRYHDALRAIEARALGKAQLDEICRKLAQRENVVEPWFKGLNRSRDIHEERAIERAFAEWSDADSVAAHIGYQLDYFCTEDIGKTSGSPSVFDFENRRWLEAAYGTKFVTLRELADIL